MDLYFLKIIGDVLSLLELANLERRNDAFPAFTVEPLHVLCLGILIELQKCAVRYLSVTDKESFFSSDK